MSTDQAEQSSDNTSASVKVGPTMPATPAPSDQPPNSGEIKVDAPRLVPEQGRAEQPAGPVKQEPTIRIDPPKADPGQADAAETGKPARGPGKLLIMSPVRGDSCDSERIEPEPASASRSLFGKRRIAAMAAVVAVAALFGAVGGALATAGFGHFSRDSGASIQTKMLDESIQRIEADLAALKISVDHATKLNTAQSAQAGKLADRLDKVEKAQAEPAAKLAKLSETVEKLRSVPAPVAAAPAAPKEATGSIAAATSATPAVAAAKQATAAAVTPAPAAPPKPEVARMPTVEGWVLRDAGNGSAVIEGREGMFEVYAGDPVPGLGRIDAIRRQDGRWVVVTSRGLIVAR